MLRGDQLLEAAVRRLDLARARGRPQAKNLERLLGRHLLRSGSDVRRRSAIGAGPVMGDQRRAVRDNPVLLQIVAQHRDRLRHELRGRALHGAVSDDASANIGGERAKTAVDGIERGQQQAPAGQGLHHDRQQKGGEESRGGPSTGLPTRTQQSDISLMYNASHGDTRHIILIPHDMNSCFDIARQSFNYADRFQTPVFVAMDLDLGMNMWSSDPLKLNQDPYDQGKRLSAQDLEEWTKAGKKFRRYFDQDGDGIPYRTVPGNQNRMASYFTRGSGHDADARYSEDEHDYKYILDRLRKKFETARKFVPKPIIEKERGVKTGIICYGSSYEPVREARDRLKARGLKTNHMLIRALPLTSEVMEFLAEHDTIYLVEQNRDGQMAAIIKDESPELGAKIVSVLIYNGLPATPLEVVNQIFAAAQSAKTA